MADKIKPGIAVRTTFVAGESPPAAKLNSLSSQLQAASRRLEAVIGDIHSESWPYSTLTATELSLAYGRSASASGALPNAPTRALDIVNLGRLIGPASNLNPHELGTQNITETVPTGKYEFALSYPPSGTALIFSDTTVFASQETVPAGLLAAGDYYVDSVGRVFTVSPTNGGTVIYTYSPITHAGGNAYQDSSFNVIPDPNQLANGLGCSIGALDGNGRRAVTLPLATHHHYNQSGSGVTLTATAPTYNQQLYLPKVLVDSFTLEEEIPAGFLYLKNFTKNIVYKDATYYYYSSTSILVGTEDITDDVNDGDTFCIITVGTDITTSIDDLRRKTRHNHDRSFGESLIPVGSLANILSVAGNSGAWVPSAIPGNHFPQYLHRDGWTDGVDQNINDENIMRGDLVLGVDGAAAGNHRTATGASAKLRFYGVASATRPAIGRDATEGLEVSADQDLGGVGFYTSADTQGARVRDGYLVPEEGIVSGLNASPGTISDEYPIRMMSLVIPVVGVDTGAEYVIDLTTYGLVEGTHIIDNATMTMSLGSVLNFGNGSWWNGEISSDWYWGHDASPLGVRITFIPGGIWGGLVDLTFRIVLFFHEPVV